MLPFALQYLYTNSCEAPLLPRTIASSQIKTIAGLLTLDEVFVARKLMVLVHAQGRRWNPKKRSWEKFEDYGTQLAAIREIVKIFGIHGRDSEGPTVPTIIDISAMSIRRREPVLRNGEQSIGTAAGDGRERWKE